MSSINDDASDEDFVIEELESTENEGEEEEVEETADADVYCCESECQGHCSLLLVPCLTNQHSCSMVCAFMYRRAAAPAKQHGRWQWGARNWHARGPGDS